MFSSVMISPPMIWLPMDKKYTKNNLLGFICFISFIYFLVKIISIFPLPEKYLTPTPEQLNNTQGLIIKDTIQNKLHSRFGVRQTETLTIKTPDGLNKYSCSIYYAKSCYVNKFKYTLSKDVFNVSARIKWAEQGGRRVVYELTIGNKVEFDFFTATNKYKLEYQSRNAELMFDMQQLAISLLIFIISAILILKRNKSKQIN